MKTVKLSDFLEENEIKFLKQRKKFGELIEFFEANIEKINKKLGQENDAKYLAYLFIYHTNIRF